MKTDEILNLFGIHDIKYISEIKTGHINKTYLVECESGKYILQSLNRDIFKNPEIIMNNISLIEKAFELDVLKRTENIDFPFFCIGDNVFIPRYLTCNGKNYTEQDGEIWRMCNYIDSSEDYQEKFFDYGSAIGTFLRIVNTGRMEFETQMNLHNFNFNLPKRNIHGDTKLDNVIFGNDRITVIDFDTAMRGYICTDYGDMIRSTTNKSFDLQTVYQITEGFADSLDGLLTKDEIDSLYSGIILVTSELAERYRAGNRNFPNKAPEQCLERQKQLILQLDEFYSHKEEIISIIKKCFG